MINFNFTPTSILIIILKPLLSISSQINVIY